MKKLIAVTGGIGCGKSVVCRIFELLGFHVYDCDSQAKKIMDNSPVIKQEIMTQIDRAVVKNGIINRQALGDIVFNDSVALQRLNSIVHSAVKTDLYNWHRETSGDIHFVETAILYQSGINEMVDDIVEVVAPKELRIRRVMARNNMGREQVLERISSQSSEQNRCNDKTIKIINDDNTSLLCQVLFAIEKVTRG